MRSSSVGVTTRRPSTDGPGRIRRSARRRSQAHEVIDQQRGRRWSSRPACRRSATPNVVGLTQAAATTRRSTECAARGRHGDHGVEHDGPGGIGHQPDRRRRTDSQRSTARSRSSSRPGSAAKSATPSVVGLTQAAATTAITNAQLDGRRTVTDGVEHDGPGRIGHQPERRSAGLARSRSVSAVALVVSSRAAAGRDAERRRPDAGCGDDGDRECAAHGRHGDHSASSTDGAGRIGDQPDRRVAGTQTRDQQRGRAGRLVRVAASARRRTWSA
mgnify:CR=1 FL=1